MFVNLWERLDGSERTADVARQAAQDAGGELQRPQDWQSYEIVQRELGAGG